MQSLFKEAEVNEHEPAKGYSAGSPASLPSVWGTSADIDAP